MRHHGIFSAEFRFTFFQMFSVVIPQELLVMACFLEYVLTMGRLSSNLHHCMCLSLGIYSAESIDHMEWLHNENTIWTGETGENKITLTIVRPEAHDAGHYSCLVQLTNGETQSASAGFLVLYSKLRTYLKTSLLHNIICIL